PDFPSPVTERARAMAHAEILAYFTGLVSARRSDPGEDVVSGLVHAQVDGRPLTTEEVLLNCDNLIIGGNEPARQAIAGTVLCLVEHPEQWRRLRAGPGLIDKSAEALPRRATPPLHLPR